MTPFILGGKNKSDPHAARLSRMSERIDALRADILSDKDRSEQLRMLEQTNERLTLLLNKETRRKEQAERGTEHVRQRLTEEIAALKAKSAEQIAELSHLRADLFDRDSQIAGLTAQVNGLRATVAQQKSQLEKRWWQWR
jgi:chromosome segregation ATPase